MASLEIHFTRHQKAISLVICALRILIAESCVKKDDVMA
jgi:hypothetical protein